MTTQVGGPNFGPLESLRWFNISDYDDLRAAVSAVDAAGGGVLYIPPGVHFGGYLESSVPVPQKPLVIRGAGAGLSVLDGADEQNTIAASVPALVSRLCKLVDANRYYVASTRPQYINQGTISTTGDAPLSTPNALMKGHDLLLRCPRRMRPGRPAYSIGTTPQYAMTFARGTVRGVIQTTRTSVRGYMFRRLSIQTTAIG